MVLLANASKQILYEAECFNLNNFNPFIHDVNKWSNIL